MYAEATIFTKRTRGNARCERTARRVEQAFRELLAQRPYHQISAADVARRCGIARSTVYRRWAGVDDLFWNTVQSRWQLIVKALVAGRLKSATADLQSLWGLPGQAAAMACERLRQEVCRRLQILLASEMERVGRRSFAEPFGVIASSAIIACLSKQDGTCLDPHAFKQLFALLHAAVVEPARQTSTRPMEAGARLPVAPFPPAVSIRESLASDDHIVSMIDGRPYRTLKRHLKRFGLTPESYRRCFALPDDYPMVAKTYSDYCRGQAQHLFASKAAAAPRRPVLAGVFA